MPSERSIDELEVGETVEHSETTAFEFWFQDWDGYLGRDRDVEDLRIADARIEGEQGNESVVIEVAADVTKIDPKVKPVFQTKERFEHEPTTTSTTPTWLKEAASFTAMAGTLAIGAFISISVLQKLNLQINGVTVESPTFLELFPAMLVILGLSLGMRYLISNIGPGADRA